MDSLVQWIWQVGIHYFLYIILLAFAIWTSKTIMLSSLKTKYNELSYKYRIRKVSSRTSFTRPTYKHPLLKHLNLILKTTRDERNENEVETFLVFSALAGILTGLLMLFSFKDIVVATVFGTLISLIPYLMLRLRLNNMRYLMSGEFLQIVQLLTQNYNAQRYDMYHALTETQKEIKNPELKKVIIKLVSDLQVSRNEHELRESVQVFTYTAGSNWSKRLGSIILKAYLYNEKVLNALMILAKQMEDTEEMLEEEKSQSMDSVYNGYLTLPVLIGSLILGYYSSGAQDWVKLQFGHKWTILLFSISALGVIFSLIISVFLKNPKNDL
ncbi:hypothetical protein D1B31_17875 [Neobacillus notoginsengisoli]|uniref:Type II secretion system protein GspF domain-containing protein n=1 Tax=Neobacillus notoginsengisoli TaxID=1578198 RepID=A0A417YQ34_9BACI|nr:hypothetical protein [Neobacillus notoginsengisoli]RHW35960.1 hypothetical protein D1B31_17875 [Neobacillus notoginsengisoli]